MNFNLKSAWRKDKTSHSLSEVYSSVKVPKNASFWRKYLAFAGPGLMIAVGYMDPETGQQILQEEHSLAIPCFL
jgi:manganese transport protein